MTSATVNGTTPKTFADKLAERMPKISAYLRLLHVTGSVFEVRGLDVGTYGHTFAGFFDDADKAAEAIARLDMEQGPRGIYLTINPVQAELLCRINNRLIKAKRGEMAADKHVTRRRWLFIDIDPERAGGVSGIPANDEEREAARIRADAVCEWLMADFGWHEPVRVDSGNGFYLLFPIDRPNDEEATTLIMRVLAAIAAKWSDAAVKIDVSVCNASRIARVFGTANRKGDSTPERPHRFANHFSAPDYLANGWAEPIPLEKLEDVAALAPADEPKRKNSKSKKSKAAKATTSTDTGKESQAGGEFNHQLMVETWLAAQQVEFQSPHTLVDGRECWPIICPFNPDHGFDAGVLQSPDGMMGFHCFHNGCEQHGWQDAKEKIGKPDADHYDPPLNFVDETERWTSIKTDEGRTHSAFARRLLNAYGDVILWVPEWKSWLLWDGCRWCIDDGGCGIMRFCLAVSDGIFHETADYHTEDAIKFATDMAKPSNWTSALKAAAAQKAVAVAELNANRWLLPCPNGTVDLRTGKFRENRKEDLLTIRCPTPFDADAASYTWDRFLDGVFPSQPMQDYVRRLCGYSLAGRAGRAEEILPVFYGEGSNGKSRFIEAIRGAVGPDFAGPAAHGLLTEKTNDRHATERASLYGKRFVFCSETGRGAALDEDLIKAMSGGDVIKARFCHKDEFEFAPTFTLFLITNHKPRVRGTDNGIWRRLNLVPWTQRFWLEWRGESGPPELKADPGITEKLQVEHSGILSWLVRGCLEWQRDGLQAPEAVRVATDEYRTAEDVIGQFVEQSCVLMPQVRVKFNELYRAFEEWCEANGEYAPKGRVVGTWLQEHGCKPFQSSGRWYQGIALEA